LFGADLLSRDGTPYRSMAFVCTGEPDVFLPSDVPPAYRSVAQARRRYLTARRDADERGLEERKRWAYVIELDDAVGESVGDHPYLYIGQTSCTPEERFAQHLDGYKASKVVRRHGVCLRPDLYLDQPILRCADEALAYERWLFSAFEAAGWPVRGGT
jgi:hypothetical protein